jgi:hypothetical protein
MIVDGASHLETGKMTLNFQSVITGFATDSGTEASRRSSVVDVRSPETLMGQIRMGLSFYHQRLFVVS